MRPSRVEAINVGGTETVLKACLQQEEKENPRLLILAGSVTSYITHTSNKNQHVVNERTLLPSPNSSSRGGGGVNAQTYWQPPRTLESHPAPKQAGKGDP